MDYYRESYQAHDRTYGSKLGPESSGPRTMSSSGLVSNLEMVETDMTILFRSLSNLSSPDVSKIEFAFYDTETIPAPEWASGCRVVAEGRWPA